MQTGKIPPPYHVPGVTLGRCPLQHPRDQDVSLDTVAFNWFHFKLHCNHGGGGGFIFIWLLALHILKYRRFQRLLPMFMSSCFHVNKILPGNRSAINHHPSGNGPWEVSGAEFPSHSRKFCGGTSALISMTSYPNSIRCYYSIGISDPVPASQALSPCADPTRAAQGWQVGQLASKPVLVLGNHYVTLIEGHISQPQFLIFVHMSAASGIH